MIKNYSIEDISNVVNRAYHTFSASFQVELNNDALSKTITLFKSSFPKTPTSLNLKKVVESDDEKNTLLLIHKIFTMIASNREKFNVSINNNFLAFDANSWRKDKHYLNLKFPTTSPEVFENRFNEEEIEKIIIPSFDGEVDYKGDRHSPSKDEIKKLINLIYEISFNAGFNALKIENLEADDLFYLITKQLKEKNSNKINTNLLLITNDEDMNQLANNTNLVFEHKENTFLFRLSSGCQA